MKKLIDFILSLCIASAYRVVYSKKEFNGDEFKIEFILKPRWYSPFYWIIPLIFLIFLIFQIPIQIIDTVYCWAKSLYLDFKVGSEKKGWNGEFKKEASKLNRWSTLVRIKYKF